MARTGPPGWRLFRSHCTVTDPMERWNDPAQAARWCASADERGVGLGFVPTMGALHEGHLELVRRAARENDHAVVSVFVNPLQFDDPADFARYPRDFEGDADLLEHAGCTAVFTGDTVGFFGTGDLSRVPRVDPGPAAQGLEGAHRPGHFEGVATIVRRLFQIVRPTRAYFGEKDFQQTLVVRHLAKALGFPKVVVCPTSREPSGLARSSRNGRLTAAERERAAALCGALSAAQAAWRGGERDPERLEAVLLDGLAHADLEPEYAAVRDPDHWTGAARPVGPLEQAQALVAARIGAVRLIDNLRLDGPALRRGGAV